jgi:hypothetical protein
MKKASFLIFILVGLVGLWAYGEWFSKSSRVYAALPQVKVGMRQPQVMQLLSTPDTTYQLPRSDSASVLVLHYDMGFGDPDAVRVLIEHDTVIAVTYNL